MLHNNIPHNNTTRMQSGFTFPTNDPKKQDASTKALRKLFGGSTDPDTFNKIKFWEHVDDDTCDALIEDIKAVEDKLTDLQKNYNIPFENLPHIEIHINSGGGSVFAALAVVDYIKASKFKFTSVIEGYAASAATFISCICDRRLITEHSMILIHQLSAGVIGKMAEMVDEINVCHKLMNVIIKMYREHTNIDIKSIKRIMSRDIFWNAEESLKLGIVDEIIKPVKSVRRVCRTTHFKISSTELEKGTLNIKRTRDEETPNPLTALLIKII
jgi:ATP-dependent Clp endopeptidase proteolytic subunit ClpP